MIQKALLRISGTLADSDWVPTILAAGHPWVRTLLGEACASLWLRYPVSLLDYVSHRAGVRDNLHTLGLAARLKQRMEGLPMRAKHAPRAKTGPLRIGLVGEMAAATARSPSIITGFPEEHTFFLFDLAWNGSFGKIANTKAMHVERHDLAGDYLRSVERLAQSINASELDMVLLANYYPQVKSHISDRIDTPCIINFTMGSAISFHPKVDFTMYAQPRKDFYLRGNRLFSEYTQRPLRGELCYPEVHIYDDRGIRPEDNPPWEKREPLIAFCGRLAQLDSPLFLECLAEILKTDRTYRFAFIGGGDNLQKIIDHFHGHNLAGQVEYLGQVPLVPHTDDVWREHILTLLRRARLAPNPWPRGGGSARVEAYLAGTPTVHLGMVNDGLNLLDTRKQTVVDLPALQVPSGTAWSIPEYKALCLRCLTDPDFARQVVDEQYILGRRAVDGAAWWGEVLNCYHRWQEDIREELKR